MNSPNGQSNEELSQDELHALEHLKVANANVREQLGKIIVGQEKVLDQLLIAIFAQGHCLLEGVPGLAKTLMFGLSGQVVATAPAQFCRCVVST